MSPHCKTFYQHIHLYQGIRTCYENKTMGEAVSEKGETRKGQLMGT